MQVSYTLKLSLAFHNEILGHEFHMLQSWASHFGTKFWDVTFKYHINSLYFMTQIYHVGGFASHVQLVNFHKQG
jgi:hypothetical protein